MARGSRQYSTGSSDDPRIIDYLEGSRVEKLGAPRDPRDTVILQYPDDEGVRLNRGRPGARKGPERILYYLGRMVFQPDQTPSLVVLKPLKNSLPLKKKHEWAETYAKKILNLGYRLLTLGGGHDYGYPDASAYYEAVHGRILNIDAHLDVRPVVGAKFNSGTPFYRFIERFGGQDFFAWGIQNHCNAVAHFKWAKERGMQIFDDRMRLPKIDGPLGLSICLDAFQGIRGVSAPAMVGLSTATGLETVRTLAPNAQWLGLYESAPQYDPLNEDSARYAALLAYHFIHSQRIPS